MYIVNRSTYIAIVKFKQTVDLLFIWITRQARLILRLFLPHL